MTLYNGFDRISKLDIVTINSTDFIDLSKSQVALSLIPKWVYSL